jgi:hypothetical protein
VSVTPSPRKSEKIASGSRDGNSEVEVNAVTLVLTVNGYESIWMLADRRLSYKDRAPKDDARKVMFLETTDGTAILGYAGLGATALGTEPSDWIGSVLRGRNLPLEQSLAVLAGAMKKQFPQHMLQLPGDGPPTHTIIVTAFLGNEPRLYTIDLAFARDRKSYQFRHTRLVANTRKLAGVMTPRFAVGGSGGQYLYRDQKWARSLLSLVRAYDRGRVSNYAVADHLASLNNEVHLGVSDKSVGPGCIVAWRHGKEGKGGNEQLFYTGTARDANSSAPLPIISNGMDINALAAVTKLHLAKQFAAWRAGEREKELDRDEINADLARLPHHPDERLR